MARETELNGKLFDLGLELLNLRHVVTLLDLELEVHQLGPRLLLHCHGDLEGGVQEVHHAHNIRLVQASGRQRRGSYNQFINY